MGGLKSWFKRATKIPKSIKKIKVGNIIKDTVLSGGNIIGAISGEQDRIKAEKEAAAQAAAAQKEIDEASRTIPVYTPGAQQPTPSVPVLPGVEVTSTRTWVVLGLAAGAVVLLFFAMRRR